MSNLLFRVGLPAVLLACAGGWGIYELTQRPAVDAGNGEEITTPGATAPTGAQRAENASQPAAIGPAGAVTAAPQQEKGEARGPGIGRTGRPPLGAAVFPDGTWLEPLNGVKNAPQFPGFAPGYPYSPVVRIITGDKGIQWYAHADGSRSTTQLVPTEQEGRKFIQPGWVVGNPTNALPVQLGSGPDGAGGDAKKGPPPPIPQRRR